MRIHSYVPRTGQAIFDPVYRSTIQQLASKMDNGTEYELFDHEGSLFVVRVIHEETPVGSKRIPPGTYIAKISAHGVSFSQSPDCDPVVSALRKRFPKIEPAPAKEPEEDAA